MRAVCYMLRTAVWSVVGCTLQVACLRTAFVPTLLIFPLLLLAIVLLLLPLFFLHDMSASDRPGLTARLQWPRTFLRFSAASLSLASCARFGAAVAGGGGGIVPQPPQDAQARWQAVWERVRGWRSRKQEGPALSHLPQFRRGPTPLGSFRGRTPQGHVVLLIADRCARLRQTMILPVHRCCGIRRSQAVA